MLHSPSPATAQIWYLDNDATVSKNHKRPNIAQPPTFIQAEELTQLSGAELMKFDADIINHCSKFADLRKQRGFIFEDEIELNKDNMKKFENDLAMFFTEHIHADDEVRMVLDGSGYFDVRDKDDKWLRIEANKDDLVIIPAGLYHRFTLDTNNYIKCKRLFSGSPVWTAFFRPEADAHPARKQFLERRNS
ncbi:1,2-dihydroxy-3-keto-5-methylthiopentene dioxygenase [Plakobranchus ocellatus]|uniref:Acireductone dioxygenase n=1 Tax=Plakobranchus ocellatus TaxID=259542 RepID=A0AAV4BY56_9GAST|nr:1,2-dihydroxy-3-keto-5-methylthiopentene dioxygenase [Plakobranchus ocellatus]